MAAYPEGATVTADGAPRPALVLVTNSRGVWVPLPVLQHVGGGASAIMLAQLMWLLHDDPGAEVVRPDHAWEADCGLTPKQARTAREHLVQLGLVTATKRRVDGAPTTCLRIDPAGLDALAAAAAQGKSFCPPGQMSSALEGKSTALPTGDVTTPPDGGGASAPQAKAKRANESAAHQLATELWKRKNPKPAQKFVAVRQVAERLLDAGHSPEAVLAAMLAVPTISIGWCEGQLNKGRATPAAVKREHVRRDAEEGVLEV